MGWGPGRKRQRDGGTGRASGRCLQAEKNRNPGSSQGEATGDPILAITQQKPRLHKRWGFSLGSTFHYLDRDVGSKGDPDGANNSPVQDRNRSREDGMVSVIDLEALRRGDERLGLALSHRSAFAGSAGTACR